MLFTVLFYIFVVVFVVQVIYHSIFLNFTFSKNKKSDLKITVPISVLVYTKNNAEQIHENLPLFLNQSYIDFEIVVVNNASYDGTREVLEKYAAQYENLKIVNVVNVENFWANKKYALTLGIKACNNSYIVCSEMISKPLSNNWLHEMAQGFTEGKEIIIAPTKVSDEYKSSFHLLYKLEHLYSNLHTFSLAKINIPYKASNFNFGFTKKRFFKVNGFINHIHSKGRFTDWFIKDAATKDNISLVYSENSFTNKPTPKSFFIWLKLLRIKQLQSFQYNATATSSLNFFYFSKFLFYSLMPIVLILNWQYSLGIVLAYYILLYINTYKISQLLQNKQVLYFLPLIDICLFCVQISIFIINLIAKPKSWK